MTEPAQPKKPRRTRVDGEPDRRGGSVPGKRGVPAHVPTDENRRVAMAAKAAGIENEAIAKALKISPDTLVRHYGADLAIGREGVTALVAGSLVKIALDPSHKDVQRAGEFWLRAQAGWRTKDERIHSFGGIDGPAPEVTDADDVKPVKVTFEFVGTRPKGLPGCAPEDRE